MNSLLIFPEEINGNRIHLSGKRASHLYDTHNLRVGDQTKIAVWNGACGMGTVISASSHGAELEFELNAVPPTRMRISAIVAIPRPPILKRVLMIAASCGIEEIALIRSAGTEKSYLTSRELDAEHIRASITAGLEQAIDSTPPRVSIHEKFLPFLDRYLSEEGSGANRFLADPNGETLDRHGTLGNADNLTVAIGPESGWNEFELKKFREAGFQLLSFGPRILRVDTALAFALGQLSTLGIF